MSNRFLGHRARLTVHHLEARLAPAVFVVTSPVDIGRGSIREAVRNANALPGPDVIRFEIPTLQPGPNIIRLTEGEIVITDSVSIVDRPSLSPTPIQHFPMIVFDAHNDSRIFNINGRNVLSVNFHGIGFTNGKTEGSGGAILNVGENVNFFSCTFSGNEAAGNGGAVESTSATLSAVNSRPMRVTFNHCRLTGNHATDGGAVHFTGPGLLSVMSTAFAENRAAGKGGAIALARGGQAVIESSSVTHNEAATAGGGLHYTGGLNTAPVDVVSTPVMVRNSTFSSNGARVNGGAIALASYGANVLLIANSTVTANTAGVNSPVLTSSGGGIHVSAPSNTSRIGRIALVSSVVSQNRSILGSDVFTPGSLGASHSALGSVNGIGTYVDRGHNLPIGVDIRLGALQDNGGPTPTHLPAADSPLLNRGDNPYELRFDQRGRGFPRVVGRRPDIGAVEREL